MLLQVPAVVMLTNVLEHGVNKCAQYYPAQESGTFSLPDFSLQVNSQLLAVLSMFMLEICNYGLALQTERTRNAARLHIVTSEDA